MCDWEEERGGAIAWFGVVVRRLVGGREWEEDDEGEGFRGDLELAEFVRDG